jgi:hypothetical protein
MFIGLEITISARFLMAGTCVISYHYALLRDIRCPSYHQERQEAFIRVGGRTVFDTVEILTNILSRPRGAIV